jgi:phosphotransferase system HPr (HPr) family protein
MYHCEATVLNQSGLHARPASLFVKKASSFGSNIRIGRTDDTTRVNAKSIVMLMSLALEAGTKVEVLAEGTDETEAVNALVDLINSKFDED